MGKLVWLMLLVYFLFGLYFINMAFVFVAIPEVVSGLDKWIFAIGGILLLGGGVNYWRAGANSY